MNTSLSPEAPPRLITSREVQGRTSLSRATIWRRIKAGQFPKPVRLGTTRIAWRESDINAWVVGCAAA